VDPHGRAVGGVELVVEEVHDALEVLGAVLVPRWDAGVGVVGVEWGAGRGRVT
jgi:hypothetical protein